MKLNITGIFFLLCLTLWLPGRMFSQTCTMTIGPSSPYIDASGSPYNSIKPGDTVCLKAGNWDYIYLRNFHGTAAKPITFVNTGGAVVVKAIVSPTNYIGIKIGGCSHIIFRGNGVSGIQYGFQVDTVAAGAGMGIDDLSTNIEVAYVEISHTAIGGVYAKTDPTCSNFSSTRDKFTMYDFSFHNCYVHDVPNEGLYIGNSHFTGFYLSGCDTTVYAQVLKGVHIFDNLIERTGYDGIQVSSADSNCQIHDNKIYSDSYQGIPDQMSGIIIGGGSKCDTYNNMIFGGKGDGIDVFGLGNFKIFNNLIVNSGQNYYPGDLTKPKHGIYVGTDSTSANATLGIYNNTIVSPKSFGIDLNNSQLDTISVINNLIVDPGAYSIDGSQSFINTGNLSPNTVDVVKKTNYTNKDIPPVQFINADSMNYDLQSTSPAVDYGTNLTSKGITFDILNRKRPGSGNFDAGAYQHDSSTGVVNHTASDVQSVKVYPNPASRQVQVKLIMKNKQTVTVSFSDVMGRIFFVRKLSFGAMQLRYFGINVAPLTNGWYFLNIFTKEGKTSIPIIVQH